MTKPKRSRLRRFFGWFVDPFRRRRRQLNDEPEDDDEDFDEEFDDEPDVLWSESRLQVAQRLWGDGFVRCGEAEYLGEFLPLMGLSERNSLLLIGAGLGGAGQKIVEDTSAWVTGYENREELAALGKERVKRAGLTKRAPVNFAAYDNLKLKARAFDACISLENLYMAADKKTVLAKVFESMRDNAELWYTDFVLPSTDAPNATVQAWADAEPEPVHLWPSDVMRPCCAIPASTCSPERTSPMHTGCGCSRACSTSSPPPTRRNCWALSMACSPNWRDWPSWWRRSIAAGSRSTAFMPSSRAGAADRAAKIPSKSGVEATRLHIHYL